MTDAMEDFALRLHCL